MFSYAIRTVIALTLIASPVLAQSPADDAEPRGAQPPITVSVTGSVTDLTGKPVAGASLDLAANPYHPTAQSAGATAVTDAQGNFALQVTGHRGLARLRTSASGFRTHTDFIGIAPGRSVTRRIRLAPPLTAEQYFAR